MREQQITDAMDALVKSNLEMSTADLDQDLRAELVEQNERNYDKLKKMLNDIRKN